MRTAIKKVYISVLVAVLCLITVGATTYAWIGILTNSEFEEFEINVNSSDLKEYGIELSLDGINFSTEISSTAVQKQILLNAGYNPLQLTTDDLVHNHFNLFKLEQCTVRPNYSNNSLSAFTNKNDVETTKYFKFDLFISAFKVYESTSTSDYKLDAFLRGDLLEGTLAKRTLMNEFTYPSNFINNTGNIMAGEKITNTYVNSSSASRLAIQKYEVVEKYKPELYSSLSIVTDLIIYQGGTKEPTIDENTGVQSFGGILDSPYNLALNEYNNFSNANFTVPQWALERAQKELIFDETTNQIIDSSKEEEKIGVSQMMKMTIYFWFEGWDSDCFEVIDRKPVTINLNFSTSYRDE